MYNFTLMNFQGTSSVLNSPQTLTVQGSPCSQGVSEGSLADFEDHVISNTVASVFEADDEEDEHEIIVSHIPSDVCLNFITGSLFTLELCFLYSCRPLLCRYQQPHQSVVQEPCSLTE